MVNETQKFVQFMANLMMAALIASVMPLPSIKPLTGRFLQASVIEPNCSLRAQYLASLQTTLQPYMWNAVIAWFRYGGNGYPSPKKSKISCVILERRI